jgi:hypothetical protein
MDDADRQGRSESLAAPPLRFLPRRSAGLDGVTPDAGRRG